jgi:hypothetical protein
MIEDLFTQLEMIEINKLLAPPAPKHWHWGNWEWPAGSEIKFEGHS